MKQLMSKKLCRGEKVIGGGHVTIDVTQEVRKNSGRKLPCFETRSEQKPSRHRHPGLKLGPSSNVGARTVGATARISKNACGLHGTQGLLFDPDSTRSAR